MNSLNSQNNENSMKDKEMIGRYSRLQLEEIFQKYCQGDEYLNRDTIEALIKNDLHLYTTKQNFNEIMNKMDINNDGQIELDEFITFMKKIDEQDEDTLKEVFAIFDKDDKGYLTPESVYHIFLSIGEKIKLEDITNVLKENDIDGDGNLNFQDFKMLMNNGLEEIERKNKDSVLLNIKSCIFNPIPGSGNKKQMGANNGRTSYNWKKNGSVIELNYVPGLNNI